MKWNMRWRGLGCAGLALAAAACDGGSSGGPAATASAAPAAEPPVTELQRWDFATAQDLVLRAEPADHAAARQEHGQLALDAAMYLDAQGQPACPLAVAEWPLTQEALRDGRYDRLVLTFSVSRWNLGLGPYDDDVPRLELVYRGRRHQLGLSGFTRMPSDVEVTWTAATGLSARYGDSASARRSVATDDSGPPRIRLWIDGCSQGMSQSLRIDRLVLAAG